MAYTRSQRKNQTMPLRKVLRVWWEGGIVRKEDLECGHTIYPPEDRMGETNAVRRRCWKCAKGLPPDEEQVKE